MRVIALLAASALASSSSAVIFTGAGGAIPDATINNSIAGSGLFTSTVSSNLTGVITGVKQVDLTGLVYGWVGDLQVTLVHVQTDTRSNLFSRFGVTTATGFGSSRNLNGNYGFVESAAPDGLWFPVPDPSDYPSGVYQQYTQGTPQPVQIGMVSGVQGLNLNGLSSMVGLNASSDWRLEIRDFAEGSLLLGDPSTLGEWSIDFEYAVPSPGALALLGLAGIAGRRRRA